ncbi:MAG: hypothetical protein ACJ8IR_12330 [Alphaproteobacteria bacterium]
MVCNPDVVDGRFTVISVGAVAVGGCAIALGGGPSGSWCGWNPDDAVGAVAVGGGPSGSCCGWNPGDAVGAVAVGVVFALLAVPGTRTACDFPPAAIAGPIATAEISAREPNKQVVRMVQSPVYLSLHPIEIQ